MIATSSDLPLISTSPRRRSHGRYSALSAAAVSSVVMICPLAACSTSLAARLTVSPNTPSSPLITGPK